MSSKDKENKSIQEKLKQFFRFSKTNSGSFRGRNDFVLTEELQRDLSRESPAATRIKVIKELSEDVLTHRLEDKAIEKLWNLIQDLLYYTQPLEMRHLAFGFLQNLVKGQTDKLDLLRAHFFRVIKQHDLTEDVSPRFEFLHALTDNGKDVRYFEEEIGPFLLRWLPDITRAGKTQEFLELLMNVIKFNAAYLDEEVVSGLVQNVCLLSYSTSHQAVVLACLQVLDTIVAYSNLPSESLSNFVGALCRIVNVEAYCQHSWKVMRNLMGTHMGHSALYTMCRILQEPALKQDGGLLRGAVFFLYMSLWGPLTQPLTNLRCPPGSVLPSILQAVSSNHAIVTYEVVLSMQNLVSNKHGLFLHEPIWDIILKILSTAFKQIDAVPNLTAHKYASINFHETLNTIENLIETGNFNGSEAQFFEIIEKCSTARPEESVLKLISYLSKSIIPTKHLWLSNLNNLLQKYYRQEIRTNIRLKVIEVLLHVIKLNRSQYEDELIDRIIVPHLSSAVNDTDVVVRTAVADLLINICMECDSKRCMEVLDILEKLFNRPFETHGADYPALDSEITDIKTIVVGLTKVFMLKIHRLPSTHALKIYKMFVHHLEQHYTRPKIFEECNQIRHKIFECFLNMRADSSFHLGCIEADGKVKCSPYLCVSYNSLDRSSLSSPPPAITQLAPCTVTYVALRRSFKCVISCLKQEKDWEVLKFVLQGIPLVLQNKSLILGKNGNKEIDLFVDALCSMLTDKTLCLPESLKSTNKPNRSDFHASVLQVLTSMPSYHAHLSEMRKRNMIWCLVRCGLVPKCSRSIISALMICTLEMGNVIMIRLLPEVLLDLSKISATVNIAIPVLEFLSTVSKLPAIYANFVGDQYMALFAICLPYTNPFKYNHYIVSLAHHVIAVWFLKCRLPFRRVFISYITKGLQTNTLVPFEETSILKSDLSKLNQDSSDRKRSSSLTEQSSRRRDRSTVVLRPDSTKPTLRPGFDRALLTFYEELTETCNDLMARYTFSTCSALPKRLPTSELLFSGGQSMTWFLGNKLITITTSGCKQKPLRYGLCDRCWTVCRLDQSRSPPEMDQQQRILKTHRSSSSEKDKDENTTSRNVTRQNSGDKSNNQTSTSSPVDENKKLLSDKLEQLPSKLQQLVAHDASKNEKQGCTCWCQGWAEIYVRRPTGDMCWVMRIQNQLSHQQSSFDLPLSEVSTLYVPSLHQGSSELESSDSHCQYEETQNTEEEFSSAASIPISIPGSPTKLSPSRQSSKDSIDEDIENIYEDGSKSRNPVRRSNSSPEMSASWKNPFLQKPDKDREREESRNADDEGSKKTKNFTKDMRVSCEAIPEEIAGMGTTPPSNAPIQSGECKHPLLLTCHSCPGAAPPEDKTVVPKTCQTVPPSPNVLQTSAPLNLSSTSQFSPQNANKSAPESSTESVSSVIPEKAIERPNTLGNLSSLAPLTTKPPQSPTQTSPRLPRHVAKDKDGHEIQKSSSLVLEKTQSSIAKTKERKNGSNERLNTSNQSELKLSNSNPIRDRGHTISVMTNVRKPRLESLRHTNSPRSTKEGPRSGISPSFIFLQLYHSSHFGSPNERPLLIGTSAVAQRAVKILDMVPPYETHSISVIYVREGQGSNETEILGNRFGSTRYAQFLQNLGTLIKLQEADSQVFYLGGLHQDGSAGKFTYIWQDDVIRVVFHVATLMPNRDNDPNFNNKKMHIGNNHVTIVYNESGEEYNINTIKGQFNFACIIVEPLDYNTNKVTVKVKEELVDLVDHCEPKIVSDQNVALLARQLALHADLAALVSRSLKNQAQNPYASNWLERLRKIKQFKTKILQEVKKERTGEQEEIYSSKKGSIDDFTEYTN